MVLAWAGAANPMERIPPEAVASLARQAVANGFQMAVHAIGDEGNDRTLKVFEEALGTERMRAHTEAAAEPSSPSRRIEAGSVRRRRSKFMSSPCRGETLPGLPRCFGLETGGRVDLLQLDAHPQIVEEIADRLGQAPRRLPALA